MVPPLSTFSCMRRFMLADVNCIFSYMGPARLFGEVGRRAT